jgi:hypothetical protein
MKLLLWMLLSASLLAQSPSFKQEFIVSTSASAAITAIDGYQTLSTGGRESESAWLYGTYPQRHPVKVSALLAVQSAAAALLSWHIHHTRRSRLWLIPEGLLSATHSYGIAHNLENR